MLFFRTHSVIGLYFETMDTRLVHRGFACLCPSFRWYSLRLPTEDGQAELVWVAWYTKTVYLHDVVNTVLYSYITN